MKRTLKLLLLIATVLLCGCPSGRNHPADSHPGSGSVKVGRNHKDKEEKKDTVIADSVKRYNP